MPATTAWRAARGTTPCTAAKAATAWTEGRAETCSPRGVLGSGYPSVMEEAVQRHLEAGELRRGQCLPASELERDVEPGDRGRRAAKDEHGLRHVVYQPQLGQPAGLVARLLGADVIAPRARRADLDAELGHACEPLAQITRPMALGDPDQVGAVDVEL